MQRRNLLIATGSTVTVSFSGCLDLSNISPESENDSNDADSEGIRSNPWLSLFNRTNERINATVNADSDGTKIVFDTFELEGTGSERSQRLERVPIGTTKLIVEAKIDFPNGDEESTHCFELPKEYQIEEFGIWIRDETIRIEATPLATPD